MPDPPAPAQTTPNPTLVLHQAPAVSPAMPLPRPSSSHRDTFDLPKIRLQVHDLSHPGADRFFTAVHPVSTLQKAVRDVLTLLYRSPSPSRPPPPPTRSVTLILRPMPGVAYTTGSDLDNDHKEIHLSLHYIAAIKPPRRAADEITGVITHELVHCYQFNGKGACPGGLIEGVADWVRLRAGLSPPHWRREASGPWDAGYQHTAYFLAHLEDRFGDGAVRRLNEALRDDKYYEATFWDGLFGEPVDKLWQEYADSLS